MSKEVQLRVTDLKDMDGEPRMSGRSLGVALGYSDPYHDIRQLVSRNDVEIKRYGNIISRRAETHQGAKSGRPAEELWFNEDQCFAAFNEQAELDAMRATRHDEWRAWLVIGSGVALVALLWWSVAHSREITPGQYDSVPDDVKAWFKAQRAPNGVPCCDVGDGYNTEARLEDGLWMVPSRKDPTVWVPVPPEAIIVGHGNPNGNHVVWWANDTYIRCFVAGALL